MLHSFMVGGGKSELGNVSSLTFVRSSYKVGKTWMLNFVLRSLRTSIINLFANMLSIWNMYV